MMMKFFTMLLVGGVMVETANGSGAQLTILPVNAFGRPLTGCQVRTLEPVGKLQGIDLNYGGRFHSLVNDDVPLGNYEIVLACGGTLMRKQITVNRPHQLEVVPGSERALVSDHVKPELAIKLDANTRVEEIWWIHMIGLYNGETYLDRFGMESGTATLIDPEPGSYLVSVESTAGYACTHRIDFVEFTRSWSFDPHGCTFHLDPFAHVVTQRDSGISESSPWYDQMQKQKEDLLRNLGEAADKR